MIDGVLSSLSIEWFESLKSECTWRDFFIFYFSFSNAVLSFHQEKLIKPYISPDTVYKNCMYIIFHSRIFVLSFAIITITLPSSKTNIIKSSSSSCTLVIVLILNLCEIYHLHETSIPLLIYRKIPLVVFRWWSHISSLIIFP